MEDAGPAVNAFLRTSRRVCERYSEGLAAAKVQARHGEVRMFVEDGDPGMAEVLVLIPLDPVSEGFESARALIPAGAEELSPAARAVLVLDVVVAAMRRLAAVRGWDLAGLESAREHVIDHGYGFEMAGPWRSSPDRKLRVRPVARVGDDGWSSVRYEVVDSRSGEFLGFTDPAADEFTFARSLSRSFKNHQWVGPRSIERTAFWFVDGSGMDTEVHRFDLSKLEAEESLAQIPAPSSPIAVRVEGRGETSPEQPPAIQWTGGVLNEREPFEYEAAEGAYRDWFAQQGLAWWTASGKAILHLVVECGGNRSGFQVRVGENSVLATCRRAAADLRFDVSDRARARSDVEELLHRVATKLGLPAPPPLPPEDELITPMHNRESAYRRHAKETDESLARAARLAGLMNASEPEA